MIPSPRYALVALFCAITLSFGALAAPSRALADEVPSEEQVPAVAADDETQDQIGLPPSDEPIIEPSLPADAEEPSDEEQTPVAPVEDALQSDETTVVEPVQPADDSASEEPQEPEPAADTDDVTPAPAPAPATADEPAPAAELADEQPSAPAADSSAAKTPANTPTAVVTAASQTDPFDGKTFVFEHGKGGVQVIDTAGGAVAKKVNAQTKAYSKALSQQWIIEKTSYMDANGNPYYLIRSAKNRSLVLDVAGGKTANGTNVRLYTCNKSASQLWRIEGSASAGYVLSSKLSEKAGRQLVLDLAGGKTANGTNVRLWTYNKSAAQHYYLLDPKPSASLAAGATLPDGDGVYQVTLTGNQKLSLDISGGSMKDQANLQLYKANGSPAQRFIFRSDGKGFYTIGVLKSGKVFELAGATIIPGANARQNAYAKSSVQKWALYEVAGKAGSYQLVNTTTGLALTIGTTVSKAANKTNVLGKIGSTSTAQQFTLTKDSTPLVSEGYYTISPIANSAVNLKIASGKLQTASVADELAQKYQFVSAGDGLYRIRTGASGAWLTSAGLDKQVGQAGSSATEESADTWKVVYDVGGFWALKNMVSGYVLDLKGGKTASGTIVQLHGSNGSAAQHLVLSPCNLVSNGLYYLNSYYSGKRLAVKDDSKLTGANLQLGNGTTNDQKFRVTKDGDYYKIKGYTTGLVVSVSNVDADFANVSQKRDKGLDSQRWDIRIADGGYLLFVNAASGMSLEARSNAIGANVVQRTFGVAPNGERWKLAKASAASTAPIISHQAATRILMIGNSFTRSPDIGGTSSHPNNLPVLLANSLTDAVVDFTVKAGSHLKDRLDENGKLTDAATQAVFYDGSDWDFVIIQEHSTTPIDAIDEYLSSVGTFCDLARSYLATPVIYGTWAYDGKGKKSDGGATWRDSVDDEVVNGSYTKDMMHEQLQDAFAQAADVTGAPVANVGQLFANKGFPASYYSSDKKHLSTTGAEMAATVIASTITSLLA